VSDVVKNGLGDLLAFVLAEGPHMAQQTLADTH